MTKAQPATLDEIKKALAEEAFEFFYQAKIGLTSGQITGGEALIRWRKPDGTTVPPVCFIPVAEQSGFISEITLAMFQRLLADYAQIREVQPRTQITFNVSATDVEREALVVAVEQGLDSGRIAAQDLCLEVTEAAALGGAEQTRARVQRLLARGVDLAMDDFGTGYASLDAIRKLPFTTLKIDQSVVREMMTSDRSAMLVHANVSLAQVLGMATVAEGVETEAIYHALLHSGCREAQGYWMSKPLPLPEYIALLKRKPIWPASHAGPLRSVLMWHVIELRRVMDWVFAAKAALAAPDGQKPLPLTDLRRARFGEWYDGDGQALRGNRTFESMRLPNAMLNEAYDAIRAGAAAGDDTQQLAAQIAKLSHYSVVLIGDLLRLESELLLSEIHNQAER